MSVVEIIFLIIAISFVVLVIFFIKLFCSASKTLDKATQTIESLQRQLDDLGHEPRNLIRHANEISANTVEKMKQLNPFFRAIANIGEEIEYKTAQSKETLLCRHLRSKSYGASEARESQLAELIEWGLLGVSIWQKFKERR